MKKILFIMIITILCSGCITINKIIEKNTAKYVVDEDTIRPYDGTQARETYDMNHGDNYISLYSYKF